MAACPVEQASYALRDSPKITAHFEPAPANDDWQNGIVLAIHGADTGRTTYWLPWYGGTDDQRHVRRTELLDPSKEIESQRRVERRGDHDFFVLDRTYRFLPELPKRGGYAPEHLLLPNLNLWYAGEVNGKRDATPRAFFDLIRCRRSTAGDRGRDVILPHVP